MSILYPPHKYINAADMSANVVGIPYRLEAYKVYCYHFQWVGSPVGTIKIYGKVDDDLDWVPIPEGEIVVNGPGGDLYNYSQVGWYKTKVEYERTSGSGTLYCSIGAKGTDKQ